MHLLAATPGRAVDNADAVDLRQSPADVVILSSADSDLACLAAAHAEQDAAAPALRLANLMQLSHNLSVDLYVENTVAAASLVIARIIGGAGYWPYGIEQLVAVARRRGILLALVTGDDSPDPELTAQSTLPGDCLRRVQGYFVNGGIGNARALLAYASFLLDRPERWPEPALIPSAGLHVRNCATPGLADMQAGWHPERPVAAIIFYRSLLQSGNLGPVDALADALSECGLNPLPLYVSSLKDPVSADLVARMLKDTATSIVLNATGFAAAGPAAAGTPFDAADCPVLQVVFSGSDRESWAASSAGLSARDIAMNVALPEFDGRILSRAVSFKSEARFDPRTECPIIAHEPVPDRIVFVARLAANWVRLHRTPPQERRIALVLANYPNRDSRIGNGVGLDTPASVVTVLRELARTGYGVTAIPDDAELLMRRLAAGPTNAAPGRAGDCSAIRFALPDYQTFLETLPAPVRVAVTGRWGQPEADPFFLDGAFVLPVLRCGKVVITIQPARGYNIDPTATYHDPGLVPPHGYLAFHAWLRRAFDAHAVVHMGKHGNLEWLPGKAVALSDCCYPEAALGPLPNLYPFIVNDPGEGSQAKRRTAAVIIDHLTPPLTRAETYGPIRALEALIDEYYEAANLDPRRLRHLASQILELVERLRIDHDCGIADADDEPDRLRKLDAYLCELKEMQIRDGLHIFGNAPDGQQLEDLLVALARVPRNRGAGGDASLHRALAADLALEDFDPLDCAMAAPWTGPRPGPLVAILPDTIWRSTGDTVERLEHLASALVNGRCTRDPGWSRTAAVMGWIETTLRPAVESSGVSELGGLLGGLDGRFVAPGPSGAPSRGRADVLPTGRNFYSVDTRAGPDGRGMASRLDGDRRAGKPLPAGPRRLAEAPRPVCLGHLEHADRW